MVKLESYGPHELQKLKVFKEDEECKDTIVFIHGGAWRDPNNTYDDFEPIMQLFADTKLNVVSINYRLSPSVSSKEEVDKFPGLRHPMHLIDVLLALKHLTERGFNIILLAGHSVGASLCLQVLSYPEIINNGLKYVNSTDFPVDLSSLEELLSTVKINSIFYIDGIYDVVELVKEYGDSYRSFIQCAFNSDAHFKTAFQLSDSSIRSPYKFIDSNTKSFIIHSRDDELLSLTQPKLFEAFLLQNSLPFETKYEAWGRHEEVYTRQELGNYIKDKLLS